MFVVSTVFRCDMMSQEYNDEDGRGREKSSTSTTSSFESTGRGKEGGIRRGLGVGEGKGREEICKRIRLLKEERRVVDQMQGKMKMRIK